MAGTILFYVAALPHFVTDLPHDHLSAERMETLESDAVAIAERLLGMTGLRPVRTPRRPGGDTHRPRIAPDAKPLGDPA